MVSKFDEQILVVPRSRLFDDERTAFNGFIGRGDERYDSIVSSFGDFEVKRRGDMEEAPSYKQLVSYVIIKSDRDDSTLVYKRLDGGGEARLHGLLSIGVGGHMNDVPESDDINDKLSVNAKRELAEEVGLEGEAVKEMEIMGLINDDDNEVGKVHIGLVLSVKVDPSIVASKEVDTLELNWEADENLPVMSPYESWSELIIRDAYGG